MSQRPDRLTISLGNDAKRRREALSTLAERLGFERKRGDGYSISGLISWLADTADFALDETVQILEVASKVAAGVGEIEDYLTPMRRVDDV